MSSTYTDLRSERQAAVEAILSAGHIPAGMELFAAGDESQMVVIRRWIDESDVFMLILGSRYGSIDPNTGKSYIQLEYEYAVAKGKALFAVVREAEPQPARDRPENAERLAEFRAFVQQRIVRMWRDPRDIKLAIHETLAEFSRRRELLGWVRADNTVDLGSVTEEVARLSRENAALRERLQAVAPRLFNGLTFDELFQLISTTAVVMGDNTPDIHAVQQIARFFGHERPAPVHVLWRFSKRLIRGTNFPPVFEHWVQKLEEASLIELQFPGYSERLFKLTETGTQFLLTLQASRDMSAAEEFRA